MSSPDAPKGQPQSDGRPDEDEVEFARKLEERFGRPYEPLTPEEAQRVCEEVAAIQQGRPYPPPDAP